MINDKAKMFNDYFHCVSFTLKSDFALPAISVKSDNMLCNDFLYYRNILIVAEYRTIFIFVLIVIYLNSYDYVVDVLKGLDVTKDLALTTYP